VIAKRRAGFVSLLSPQEETASCGMLSAIATSAAGSIAVALTAVDETVDITFSLVESINGLTVVRAKAAFNRSKVWCRAGSVADV
jgi:hypothetical protein